ncbi:hypothetical protein C4559_00030 [Candidatus Microgenomates bacterium]|nr:MAG: hypothetical protein C4559_00030 [Candidatus Microgenomates bacterium]
MRKEVARYSGSPDGKAITKLPLTREQIIAIRNAEKFGKELAANLPQIAQLYRDGTTSIELGKQYQEEMNIIAKGAKFSNYYAIMYALSQLIPAKEMREIGKEHMKHAGEKCRDEKLGFFGADEEKMQAARFKGLSTQRERGIGIFTSDPAKIHEAAIRRVIAQGKRPITDKEREYLLKLYNDPDFQHKSGPSKGKPDYSLIAKAMRQELKINRKEESFRTIIYLARKSQEKIA